MRYTTTLILVRDFYRRRYKLNEDEEAKQEYQASLLILVYKSLYSMERFQCHKFGSTTEWRYFFENLALCFAFHIPFYSPPNPGYLFCTPRLLACFLDETCLWGKSPLPRHWFTDWSWIWLLQWVLDFFDVSTTLNFSGGSPEPFTLDLLSIDPFPILVQPGGLVTVAAQITLKEVIDVGAKVSFNIVMEGLIPIPIPCLDLSDLGVDTSIGSWWYTFSLSLHSLKTSAPTMVTRSWQLPPTSSAQHMSLNTRTVPYPLDLASTEAENLWPLDSDP